MCSTNIGREIDIEELNKKYDKIMQKEFEKPTVEEALLLKPMIEEILKYDVLTDKIFKDLKTKYKCFGKKNSYFIHVFRELVKINELSIDFDEKIRNFLRIKNGKSLSGVIVLTVFTSGTPEYINDKGIKIKDNFSCNWSCSFCPNEPGQPRSYLKLENGVLRANQNHFDCYKQIISRLNALYTIGHQIDKLEVIISGGTFYSYHKNYREQFIRDIFYTANTFFDIKRERLDILEEKKINKTAKVKVIGITIETRPDCIIPSELKLFRKWEITRVAIGLQHLDQEILDKNNRSCKIETVKKAIKLLKDNCFKIDIHIMLNLPGSSPDKDRKMLIDQFLGLNKHIKRVFKEPYWYNKLFYKNIKSELWEYYDLSEPDLSGDQWKLYPCMITPWTDIEEWFKTGLYKPFSDNELRDILIDAKSIIYPWIRINRLIRDFPEGDYSINNTHIGSMRNDIKSIMKKNHLSCNCIRCREPGNIQFDNNYIITIRVYKASDGIEYFISAESNDNKIIYGFVRLRIPSEKINNLFEELSFCALIRELHVYGRIETVIDNTSKSNMQHQGIGKTLMAKAEIIAKENKYYRLAVIAGMGVKGYYEKIGYKEYKGDGYFMIKDLN